MNYLDGLNEKQSEAVLNTEGPVLILAGAGTGKTKTLTTRVVHIIKSSQAQAGEILAVTFTNKASKEMAERIVKLSDDGAHGLWIGTFHAIAARILRAHASLIVKPKENKTKEHKTTYNNELFFSQESTKHTSNYPIFSSNFVIIGVDDQNKILENVINELYPTLLQDNKRKNINKISYLIQGWKDKGLLPAQILPHNLVSDIQHMAKAIYAQYQTRLLISNSMDFGDILLYSVQLFNQNIEILDIYRNKFKYILVDEYQDTNTIQYIWLRLLAQKHKNICCVGDEDQSIYGWRGAEIDHILNFSKDFDNANIIRLEKNYRSTSHILAVASNIIKNNQHRLGKTLYTNIAGKKVNLNMFENSLQESRSIAQQIEAIQQTVNPLNKSASIAILVRSNAQMRYIEDNLVEYSIPYMVIGGLRFYERQEIKDSLAYLRVIINPDDDAAFERVLTTPKRGIGKTTISNLYSRAIKEGISLYAVAKNDLHTQEILTKRSVISMSNLLKDIKLWQDLMDSTSASNMLKSVLEKSGYLTMLQKDDNYEARKDNINELLNAIQEFTDLTSFLEKASLTAATDPMNNESDNVNLMTLHAAKGLEFDHVFLPGWEEGTFPNQRALNEKPSNKGLEEERRLAYVGITRAKKDLYISCARFNRNRYCTPSRFFNEISKENVNVHGIDEHVIYHD